MSNKVWVSQYRDDVDLTHANDFGEIKIITDVEVPRAFVGPKYDKFREDIYQFLELYTDDDFMLFLGSPQQMFSVVGAMSHVGIDTVKILKWMKREKKYVSIRVPLHL